VRREDEGSREESGMISGHFTVRFMIGALCLESGLVRLDTAEHL